MTSVPFNVGISGNRRSSRVLMPPGGGHTDIFGGPTPEPRFGKKQGPQIAEELANENNHATPEPALSKLEPTPEESCERPEPQNKSSAPECSPAPACAAPTPPEPEAPKGVQKRVPPGGFSSGPFW